MLLSAGFAGVSSRGTSVGLFGYRAHVDPADRTMEILRQAKALALEYRKLTDKPLGVTGEVSEFEAARILGLRLSVARQAGYDAVEVVDGTERLLQIKGRCVLNKSKRGQQLGAIRTDTEWDAVLMVLLDDNLDAYAIYEADRDKVLKALAAPGSRARNERGALSLSKFRAIGRLRWKREPQNA